MKAPVAAVALALLAGPAQHCQGFRLHASSPLGSSSAVGRVATRRARGALSAVQSMPPPTATSSSSGSPERPAVWTPETWRQATPRQMPVYDDSVR